MHGPRDCIQPAGDAFNGPQVEGRIGAKEINNVAEVEFCWALLYAEDLVWAGYSSGETRVYDPETFALVKELYQVPSALPPLLPSLWWHLVVKGALCRCLVLLYFVCVGVAVWCGVA